MFTPQDPQFEKRVRHSFSEQKVMATFGAELTRVAPGIIDIEMPFREDLTQQHGFLHAGVVATLLDSACGYAAFSLMPPDAAVLAVEFKVNLMAPAQGDALSARAQVKRAGRTLTICTADAYTITNGVEKLVAAMQGTIMNVVDRGISE
jgi:uncharacterized protein (TIGR00369 family)